MSPEDDDKKRPGAEHAAFLEAFRKALAELGYGRKRDRTSPAADGEAADDAGSPPASEGADDSDDVDDDDAGGPEVRDGC